MTASTNALQPFLNYHLHLFRDQSARGRIQGFKESSFRSHEAYTGRLIQVQHTVFRWPTESDEQQAHDSHAPRRSHPDGDLWTTVTDGETRIAACIPGSAWRGDSQCVQAGGVTALLGGTFHCESFALLYCALPTTEGYESKFTKRELAPQLCLEILRLRYIGGENSQPTRPIQDYAWAGNELLEWISSLRQRWNAFPEHHIMQTSDKTQRLLKRSSPPAFHGSPPKRQRLDQPSSPQREFTDMEAVEEEFQTQAVFRRESSDGDDDDAQCSVGRDQRDHSQSRRESEQPQSDARASRSPRAASPVRFDSSAQHAFKPEIKSQTQIRQQNKISTQESPTAPTSHGALNIASFPNGNAPSPPPSPDTTSQSNELTALNLLQALPMFNFDDMDSLSPSESRASTPIEEFVTIVSGPASGNITHPDGDRPVQEVVSEASEAVSHARTSLFAGPAVAPGSLFDNFLRNIDESGPTETASGLVQAQTSPNATTAPQEPVSSTLNDIARFMMDPNLVNFGIGDSTLPSGIVRIGRHTTYRFPSRAELGFDKTAVLRQDLLKSLLTS